MLRRLAFVALEAAARPRTAGVPAERSLISAVAPSLSACGQDLLVVRLTDISSPAVHSERAWEGSEGCGGAALLGGHVDAGGRRWKQSWQKERGQRSAMSWKAGGAEARENGGASKDLFSGPPESLALPSSSPLFRKDTSPGGWRQLGLRIMGYYTKESQIARGATGLYERITSQVEDERLYKALHLPVTFRSTYSLLVLHVWLCLVRLRKDGPAKGAPVGQLLYDLFQHDTEKRVAGAGVSMAASRYLRDLEKNFYGAAGVYDTAIASAASTGDLAQALWRNVLAEDGDPRELSADRQKDAENLARYVRQELASLDRTDSDAFLSGNIKFHDDFR